MVTVNLFRIGPIKLTVTIIPIEGRATHGAVADNIGWSDDWNGLESVEIGGGEVGKDTKKSAKCSGGGGLDSRVNGYPVLLDIRKRVVYSSFCLNNS